LDDQDIGEQPRKPENAAADDGQNDFNQKPESHAVSINRIVHTGRRHISQDCFMADHF
jgi:hypothetical protein